MVRAEPRMQKMCRPWMGWSDARFVVEEVPLARLVEGRATPFYVTSLSAFEDRLQRYSRTLKEAFPKSRVFYALKANAGLPLVESVKFAGEGFDIVSRGELEHLLKAGVNPATICYAGVGKTAAEIRAALEASVGILNVEHTEELRLALNLMAEIPTATKIALRLNPCLEIETHPHLRTGALDSKFGMLEQEILSFLDAQGSRLALDAVTGIHVHVGSQLLTGKLFAGVVAATTRLAVALLARGVTIRHLDFGGGLGVGFGGVPQDGSDITTHVAGLSTALRLACEGEPQLEKIWGRGFENVTVCLEPGRSVVASSTLFVTRALYTRTNHPDHRFVYVDGGMNDFPRPAIYGAHHAVAVAIRDEDPLRRSQAVAGGPGLQIVGPVCESGDVLRRQLSPEEIETVAPGDVVVFFEAGAYCRSMASTYNLRPLPETCYVRGDRWHSDASPSEEA